MFQRLLQLPQLLEQKSFFLFGPRGTGKSFLIRHQLADQPVLNLLDARLYDALRANPQAIDGILKTVPSYQWVVIDEVQRVPDLLNEVHRRIEEQQERFLLTGSSARRLKAGGVNLLAGRAWEAQLFPLTTAEIPHFDLTRYLHYGGLPSIYNSQNPKEELIAYAKTYLNEEIQAEAFVRKIPAFSKFMQLAALTSGQTINFNAFSNDAGVSLATIREYYQILEDTFIGFTVPAWQKTQKRKPVSTAKFYLFDTGVKNILAHISHVPEASDLYGQCFEQFIAMELRAAISYQRLHKTLCYWRTQRGHEVDFIVGDKIAIEVKCTQRVAHKHLKGLKYLQEENLCQQYYLVSRDTLHRIEDGIEIIPWQLFLEKVHHEGLLYTERHQRQ